MIANMHIDICFALISSRHLPYSAIIDIQKIINGKIDNKLKLYPRYINISSNYDHTIISVIFNDEMSPMRKQAFMK